MENTPNNREEHSYHDELDADEAKFEDEWNKERLYEEGILRWRDVPELARRWLEELKSVASQEMDRAPGSTPKESELNHDDYYRTKPPGDKRPVRLENGQVLWVELGGRRTEEGYRDIEISDQPPRTEYAILAALTALEVEGSSIEIERLREALSLIEHPLKEAMEAPGGVPGMPIGIDRSIEYVAALLRYYWPGFDSLPHEDQLAQIERACGYVNEYLKSLRNIRAFLEYGRIDVPLKSAIRSARKYAQKDVWAAVFRDVEGLKDRELGELLQMPPTDHDVIKGDNQTARKTADRGREFLEKALGKEGWKKQIEAMTAEVVWWRSLSKEERGVVRKAEEKGSTLEERREELEEELEQLGGRLPEAVSGMLPEGSKEEFNELLKGLKANREEELRLVRSVLGQGFADDSEDR
jgi:hypothetical protein